MKEETRLQPARLEGKAIARTIVDAIDDERKKRGVTMSQLSLAIGNPRALWQQINTRGNANLDTIARTCAALGIEIVLVDREGSALT